MALVSGPNCLVRSAENGHKSTEGLLVLKSLGSQTVSCRYTNTKTDQLVNYGSTDRGDTCNYMVSFPLSNSLWGWRQNLYTYVRVVLLRGVRTRQQ
jgi:hypothetical protein